ncbi:Telomerase-binding EST1A [Fusarium albosuccineum]|uniref:Telomerase-binding EST1A n=1 Tax=Fusarium albosuccineum TaxID=1237068 RepID=A0A8H4LPR3_9HYPO|nr:Telomerase-binding EST1A [Fusarium albosuccineum]
MSWVVVEDDASCVSSDASINRPLGADPVAHDNQATPAATYAFTTCPPNKSLNTSAKDVTTGNVITTDIQNALPNPPVPKKKAEKASPSSIRIVYQLETRLKSVDQLIAEVRAIYNTLTNLETRCCKDTQLGTTISIDHERYRASCQAPAEQIRLRYRLPGSSEHLVDFVYLAYRMLSLLQETTVSFDMTWAEGKGDLARYRKITAENDKTRRHWQEVSVEQYTQVLDNDPTDGLFYHHLAILKRGSYLGQLCGFTKALSVQKPFFLARESLFIPLEEFVAPKHQKTSQPAEGLSADQFNLYTAISYFILASQEPELLVENGYDMCRETHLDSFDSAVANIADTSHPFSVRPCAELGLLLCQLLLGIPPDGKRRSPMMAMWAPDFVESTDRADFARTTASDAFPIAKRAAKLMSAVVSRILGGQPDTTDLKLWRFIHVLLVFMRALVTRPILKELFGHIFHPELIAPLLNVALRQLEIQGGDDFRRVLEPGFPVMYSRLNKRQKPDNSSPRTSDAQSLGTKTKESTLQVEKDIEMGGSMAEVDFDIKTIADSSVGPHVAAHDVKHGPLVPPSSHFPCSGPGEEGPIEELVYSCPLPEDYELRGHFFARETPRTPRSDLEKEAEEVRQEGLRRDGYLFPAGWLEDSKYDFEERRVHEEFFEDLDMVRNRTVRILWMAKRLSQSNNFFSWKTDGDGYHRFEVPGILSGSRTCVDAKMPEGIKRDGGAEVVCVDPTLLSEIARTDALWQRSEWIARGGEERGQKWKEGKTTKDARDPPSVVNENEASPKNVINALIGVPSVTSTGDDAISALDLDWAKKNGYVDAAVAIPIDQAAKVTPLTKTLLNQWDRHCEGEEDMIIPHWIFHQCCCYCGYECTPWIQFPHLVGCSKD